MTDLPISVEHCSTHKPWCGKAFTHAFQDYQPITEADLHLDHILELLVLFFQYSWLAIFANVRFSANDSLQT